MTDFQLWPHQNAAIREFVDHLRAGRKRVLVSLPTGSGKSEVAAKLAKMCSEQGKQVVFTAPKIVLVEQTLQVFANRFGLPIYEFGVLQGANTRNLSAPFIIATPQTIARRGLPPKVALVVIDECHTQFDALYDALDGLERQPTILGLTATPYSKGLAERFDALVCTATTDGLCESGELVPIKPYVAEFGINTEGLNYNRQTGDYGSAKDIEDRTTEKILNGASSRWEQVCQKEFGKVVPSIAFSRSIDQGALLVEEFRSRGYDFRQIHSGDDPDQRAKNIEDFRNGDCIGLVSVAVLAEGFDVREVGCVINARPTKSLTRLIQTIGRGQRACPSINKQHCVYLDLTSSIEDAHGKLCLHWADGPQSLSEKAKPTNSGSSPRLKDCPKCGRLVAIATKECPECGYQWPANVVALEAGELKELARPDYSKYSIEDLVQVLSTEIGIKGRGWAWSLICTMAHNQLKHGTTVGNLYRVACAKWCSFEERGVFEHLHGNPYHSKGVSKTRIENEYLDMAVQLDIKVYQAKQRDFWEAA